MTSVGAVRGRPCLGVLMAPPSVKEPLTEVARQAEALGFDAFYLPDHFNEMLSPIPAIAAVTAITSMRVGAYVLANDLRHPSMVARDFATLDVLSGGRVELGVGAGWWPADYHAVGLEMDSPARRISRLREAVSLIRSCWMDEHVDHDGAWYQTRLKPMTRPVQQPHPPIIVAGGGPKLLRVAAEVADVVSIGIPLTSGRRADMAYTSAAATFEEVARRVRLVREQGSRVRRIDILLFRVEVTNRSDEMVDQVAEESGVTPDQVRASPYVHVGSLSEVASGFRDLMAIGIDSIVVRAADMKAAARVGNALRAG